MSESTRELGFYTKEKSTKAFITNVASVSIPRGYRAHQMSEFLCSVPELTLVLRSRPKWPVTAPRPGCVQRGREGGQVPSRAQQHKRKRGDRRADKDSKGKQEPSQGRGPKLGGDPGSASRAGSRAPPTSDNPLSVLSQAVRGALTPPTSTPGLLSAQNRRAQPSPAALTPQEALAPSSSSPLQAGDVGLTARA